MEFRIAAIFSLISTLVVSHQAHVLKLLDPNTPVLSPAQRYAAFHGSDETDVRMEEEADDARAAVNRAAMGYQKEADYKINPEQFSLSQEVLETGAAVNFPGDFHHRGFAVNYPNVDRATITTGAYGDYMKPQDFGYTSNRANLNLDLLLKELAQQFRPTEQGFGYMPGTNDLDWYQILAEVLQYQKPPVYYYEGAELSDMFTGDTGAVTSYPPPQGSTYMSDPVNVHSSQFLDEWDQHPQSEDYFDDGTVLSDMLITVPGAVSFPPAQQGFVYMSDPVYQLVDELEQYQTPTDYLNIVAVLPDLFTGGAGVVAISPASPATYSVPQTYTSQELYGTPSSSFSISLTIPKVDGAGGVAISPAPQTAYVAQLIYPLQQLYGDPSPSSVHGSDEADVPMEEEAEDARAAVKRAAVGYQKVADYKINPEQFSLNQELLGTGSTVNFPGDFHHRGFALNYPNVDRATITSGAYGAYMKAQDFGYMSNRANLNLDLLLTELALQFRPAEQGLGYRPGIIELDRYQLLGELEQYQKPPVYYDDGAELSDMLIGDTGAATSSLPPQGSPYMSDPVNVHSSQFLDEWEQHHEPEDYFDDGTMLSDILITIPGAVSFPPAQQGFVYMSDPVNQLLLDIVAVLPDLFTDGAGVVAISPASPATYSVPQTYTPQELYGTPSSPFSISLTIPQVHGAGEVAIPPAPQTAYVAHLIYPLQQLYGDPSPSSGTPLGSSEIGDAGMVAFPSAPVETYDEPEIYPWQ